MSHIPFGLGMDPFFGDLGMLGGGWGAGMPTRTSRSVWPASSTALVPTDDRQLLDFERLAADPLPVDVEDREHEYLVRVHQREAGMTKRDLRVDVENGMLTIRGERESESSDATSGSYSRRYRSVSRAMSLPDYVDQNKIEARYEGNNLMIHLPKITGAPGARRSIQIGGMPHGQQLEEKQQTTGPKVGQGQMHIGQGQGKEQGQGQGQGQMQGQTQSQTEKSHAAQTHGHTQEQRQGPTTRA